MRKMARVLEDQITRLRARSLGVVGDQRPAGDHVAQVGCLFFVLELGDVENERFGRVAL